MASERGGELGRRALDWFVGFAPSLARLATGLKIMAVVGLVTPVLILLMLLADQWPPDLKVLVVLGIIFVALAWLPFSLYGFAGSVQSLSEVPGTIVGTPELYRAYGAEVTRLYQELGDPALGPGRTIGHGVMGGLKLIWRMRKEVPDLAGLASLARFSLFLFALGGVVMVFVNLFLVVLVAGGTAVHQ